MTRWPVTFWRSVLVELVRLVLLSTGVLVTVIAFGASVKPLSDGLLEPGTAIKYISLAIPPMLAYALPFASGLAATLVYHRAAQDNEIVAAQAGGLSHRSILAPALIMAVTTSVCLVVLNERVIPRFLRSMAELVTQDMPKFMAQQISKGNSVRIGNGALLYADAAYRSGPDASSGAVDRMVLSRLAGIELKNDEVVTVLTARRADLWFFPPGDTFGVAGAGGGSGEIDPADQSRVHMRLYSALYDRAGETFAGLNDVGTASFGVPEFWLDKPTYLTDTELRALRSRPENINWIDMRRRKLAYELAQRKTLSDMKETISRTGVLNLTDDAGREVRVRSSGMEWDGQQWQLRPIAAGGEIELRLAGADREAAVLMYARRASPSIELAPERSASRLGVTLKLERVRTMVEGAELGAAGGATERAAQVLSGLAINSPHEQAFLAMNTTELLSAARRAELGAGPDRVGEAAADLSRWLGTLMRDVTAKQHERMALAATCFLAILTGALTAMKLSSRLPLSVYLWTFFPALACWVTISGGQQLVRQSGEIGLLLLWLGVVLLGLYAWVVYKTLPPKGQRARAYVNVAE